mmetsp:Transcript_107908/g.315492  ORF Transcript_107908/g.315492 Transcript_107908/m.315492 type:complete len:387 (+) Transcript_107908:871-2031(+)
MHDVAARDGHLDLEQILAVLVDLARHAHLPQQLPHVRLGELLQRESALHPGDAGIHLPGLELRVKDLVPGLREGVARVVVRVNNLHRLRGEGLGAVLRKHGHDRVQRDVCLRVVRGRALDEDVLGLKADLGVLTIDDGRQGQHHPVAIVDHRVHGAVTDDGQVCLQLLMRRQDLHHPVAVHLLLLIQRPEPDVLRWQCLIGERGLQRGKVVSANGHQGSAATDVHVKLVLEVDKALVSILIEGHSAQHCADDVGPDLGSGRMHSHAHLRLGFGLREHIARRLHVTLEDLQSPHQALQAKQIVAVRGNINLEDHTLAQAAGSCLAPLFRNNLKVRGHIVKLQAKLEAEVSKGLLGDFADGLLQRILVNTHRRHGCRLGPGAPKRSSA